MKSTPADKLPSQSDVERRIVRLLGLRQRPVELRDFYDELADACKLDHAQRRAKMPDGRLAWNNRVQFAKRRLIDEGLLARNGPRGYLVLSAKGRDEFRRRQRSDLLLSLLD